MRIAFVTAYPPSRIRTRSFSFLRELAREHEVMSVCTRTGDQDSQDVAALRALGVRVVAVRNPTVAAIARVARAALLGEALQVAYGAHPLVRATLQQLIGSGQIDVVHIEHLRAAAFALELDAPVVWDSVDCISQVYAAGARSGATPIMRWLGALEARRTRLAETALLASLDHVVVAAERDRAALFDAMIMHDAPCQRGAVPTIHVIPNGVDTDYFAFSPKPRPENLIVMSGNMGYHANVAAALILVRRIMPRIWERRPDVRLVLAGGKPSRAVRALGEDARVTITGYVPDLRPFIADATVAVSPTPYAFGIQNKVMEALALGTPVVATSSSVGGLGPIPDDVALVADAPDDFAAAVLGLLEDPSRRAQMSIRGRRYVETRYQWRAATQRLVSVYEAAIAAFAARSASSPAHAASDPPTIGA